MDFLQIYSLLVTLGVLVFIILKYSRKSTIPEAVLPVSRKGPMDFELDYEILVETFRQRDLFFTLEVQLDDQRLLRLIFGFGMYRKLQLNGVQLNGNNVWYGQIYLNIGGPTLQDTYVFNPLLFDEFSSPEVYLYPDDHGNDVLDKGFSIRFQIDNSLNKKLVLLSKEIEVDWKHLPKETLETNVQDIIAESAVHLVDHGQHFNLLGLSGSWNPDQILELDSQTFVMLGVGNISYVRLALKSDLKFCLLSRSELGVSPAKSIDEESVIQFLKEKLSTSFFVDYAQQNKSTCCYLDKNREMAMHPLGLHNISLGEHSIAGYRELLLLRLRSGVDPEELDIKFTPQHILHKDYCLVWAS